MNDVISFQNGAETALVRNAFLDNHTYTSILPTYKIQTLYEWFGLNEMLLRIPSMLMLCFALVVVYCLGRKIFGDKTISLVMIVVMSGLFLVNAAKFALIDSWIFALQIMLYIAFILYIKQPKLEWKILIHALILFGAIVAPYAILVWTVGLSIYFYLAHYQGDRLVRLHHWISVLVVIALVLFMDFDQVNRLYDIDWVFFWIYTLLGVSPWIAFVPAGLIDLIQKLHKKEEMAILIFGGLLMSLLTASLSIQFFIALIVAKQVQLYFQKNYPYENFVKAIGVLHIVTFVSLSIIALLWAFSDLQMMGFRVVMMICLVYWIPSFVAIIGLYSKRQNLIVGGMSSAGVLVTLFFWLQYAPLAIDYFNTEKKIVKQAMETYPIDAYYYQPFRSDILVPHNAYAFDIYGLYFYGKEDLKTTKSVSISPLIEEENEHTYRSNMPIWGGKKWYEVTAIKSEKN